jgi:cysteine sulfinate desulfinase/cysteine desulfurase-like protein
MRRVYLDRIAATPLRPQVLEAMLPYLKENFGNPQSLHSVGQEALTAVEEHTSFSLRSNINLFFIQPRALKNSGSG